MKITNEMKSVIRNRVISNIREYVKAENDKYSKRYVKVTNKAISKRNAAREAVRNSPLGKEYAKAVNTLHRAGIKGDYGNPLPVLLRALPLIDENLVNENITYTVFSLNSREYSGGVVGLSSLYVSANRQLVTDKEEDAVVKKVAEMVNNYESALFSLSLEGDEAKVRAVLARFGLTV